MKIVQNIVLLVGSLVLLFLCTGCAGGKLSEKYLFGGIPHDILQFGPKWPEPVLAQNKAIAQNAERQGVRVLNGMAHGYAVPRSALPDSPRPRMRETYISNGRTFHATGEGSQVWANVWQDQNTPNVLYFQPNVQEWSYDVSGTVPRWYFIQTEIAPGQGAIIGNAGTRAWSLVPAPRPQKPPRIIRLN